MATGAPAAESAQTTIRAATGQEFRFLGRLYFVLGTTMFMSTKGSQAAADLVVQYCKVVSSSVETEPDTGKTLPVQFNIDGIAWFPEETGENSTNVDVFGALGILGRPLPPGETEHAETLCIRGVDELTPIAARDVRLRMGGTAPNEGTMAFVGYGGAFHSVSPVDNDDLDKGAIHVIYCPYDFDSSGVAQKAHSITLDPTTDNESISIVHAEGMAITMLNDDKKALVMKNAAGDATLRLDDDGITLTAQTITLSGGVIVGEPAVAVPLLAGPASPASTKFFVSP